MTLYAESSAVLAWLLGEAAGDPVRTALARASSVVASDLTLIECERALIRSLRASELSEAEAADRRGHLTASTLAWHTLRLHPEVAERALQPFPVEPIRTLDAIHLASALSARVALPGLAMLALDERVRQNARELGFSVVPAA